MLSADVCDGVGVVGVAVGVTQFTGSLLLVDRTAAGLVTAAPQLFVVFLEPARPPRTAGGPGGLGGPWWTPAAPALLAVLHVSLHFTHFTRSTRDASITRRDRSRSRQFLQ